MQLLLASSSTYRRELLSRLGMEFAYCAPEIDETPLPGETADALVRRLAGAKARAVAAGYPGHIIIGSDQVAIASGDIINKPGCPAKAREQLARLSGRQVTFLTGVCVFSPATGQTATEVIATDVFYRTLSAGEIERYLAREPAHDCVGSVKAEGLGIALFDAVRSDDPTALIGLPLICLRQMLSGFDCHII